MTLGYGRITPVSVSVVTLPPPLLFLSQISLLLALITTPATGFMFHLDNPRASLVAQTVKKLPAMQEIWVQYQGWEDPLEKGVATHFLDNPGSSPHLKVFNYLCKDLVSK